MELAEVIGWNSSVQGLKEIQVWNKFRYFRHAMALRRLVKRHQRNQELKSARDQL